jgi:pimeloyl-ACP methyl ester carboxylesterase
VGVVFLHSGITDARQWEREIREWRFEAEAPDVHEGFELDKPSILVGNSFGGRVAMELALARPDLVTGLVLVASALPGSASSPELDAIDEHEERLYEAGDYASAAQLMVETWVPGAPEHVRAYVREAQERAYEQPAVDWLPRANRPLSERLGDIRAPVLLVDGELDRPEFHQIADRLEREVADVRGRTTIPGAHHLPNLERPEEFDAAVLPFIDGLRRASPPIPA